MDSKATLYSTHLPQFSRRCHSHKQKYSLKEKEVKGTRIQNHLYLTSLPDAMSIVLLENSILMSSCIYTFYAFIGDSVKVRVLAVLLTAISSVHLGSLIKHVLTNSVIK